MTSAAITIHKNEKGFQTFMEAYDKVMTHWRFPCETFKIGTEYGDCHVIASGPADGKPIVMFHGMTGNSSLWYPTVEPLQSTHRIYCIDAPGDFGKSTIVRRIKTQEDAVRWIDQVLSGLALESSCFIGHSMGGWFSSNYALARPDKVERLVLIAPVATFMPIPILKLLRHIYPAMLLPSPGRIKRGWDLFCAKGYSLPQDIMNMVIAAYMHCRSQLSVVPRVYPKEAWAGMKAPVLFLVGDEEQIYAAHNVCKRVSESIPHAKISVIPRAGHCLIIEQAGLVNVEIASFLAD